MSYGLRVKDANGNMTTVTPKVSTIISSGRVTLSNSLNGDGTYGTDIDLPGTIAIPQANITVLILPVDFTFKITNIAFTAGILTQHIGYMKTAQSYYQHNKATGAMTAWTAGNLTQDSPTTYDHIASIFPIAFWDLMGDTTFTNIRLFAATCYLIYDTSATSYLKVYSIGADGVSTVDYMIAIKNWDF